MIKVVKIVRSLFMGSVGREKAVHILMIKAKLKLVKNMKVRVIVLMGKGVISVMT